MKLSDAELRQINDKTDGLCCVCGSDQYLQIHHIKRRRLGNDTPDNLVLMCFGCHGKLHSNPKVTEQYNKICFAHLGENWQLNKECMRERKQKNKSRNEAKNKRDRSLRKKLKDKK